MYWASLSFTFTDTSTVVDKYFPVMMPGWCKFIKVKVPNFTNAITATLTIYDPDGDVIYTKADIAKNAVTLEEGKTLPIHPKAKVNVTLSGAAGGTGGTVLVRFSQVE